MAFDAFQAYLSTAYRSPATGAPLGPATASDYPSRLRRLERECKIHVTDAPPGILRMIADTLKHDTRVAAIVPPAFLTDVASALRAYAMFRESSANRDGVNAGDKVGLQFHEAAQTLRDLGFTERATLSDMIAGFQRDALLLYATKYPGRLVVIHPAFESVHSALANISGASSQGPLRFFEDAGFSRFPTRNNGQRRIHYGIPFAFTSVQQVRAFMDALRASLDSPSGPGSDMSVRESLATTETEATVLAKARLGQGRFRAELIDMWEGTCPLTGVTMPEMLRASHIKPWRDSIDYERLDPCNGLLLAVHLDALFDRSLITFRDTGEMIISDRLASPERQAFGLDQPRRNVLLSQAHLGYLRHHRARFGPGGNDA